MSNERGILYDPWLELLAHDAEEFLNGFLVAFEEVPLTDFLAADQASTLQGRQMRGHGGLRQAAALVDLSGADTVCVPVLLVGELVLRVFQPGENVSAYWVCQRFYYFVEVKGHGRCSGWIKRYIAMGRNIYWCFAIYQYDFDLISV